MSLAVVGADHPNKRGPSRRFDIALCKPGDRIALRPETKNPADEYAVAVYSEREVQLGYLTSERAALISPMINRAATVVCVFQRLTPWGCWIRASFDGQAPSLEGLDLTPGEGAERGDDPDWYPDEIFPDD